MVKADCFNVNVKMMYDDDIFRKAYKEIRDNMTKIGPETPNSGTAVVAENNEKEQPSILLSSGDAFPRLKESTSTRRVAVENECAERTSDRKEGIPMYGSLPEIIELKAHPWFLGVQFHPELKSRPFKPHPIFISFIEATKKTK